MSFRRKQPKTAADDSIEDEYQALETAGDSLLLLFKKKRFWDVIFTFPNLPDQIKAHKIFLQARSTVFAQKFRELESENAPGRKIEISEFTPEAFQKFLEFIYIDKFEVDIVGALELLQLSQKYQVHPLTRKCKELLKSEIPILDSVRVFEAARRYGHLELLDRAGPLVVKSFSELLRKGALANAKEETWVYLLECDELAVKEVKLFECILSWGRERAGPSADEEQLKKKLANLIPRVRYTNMAPDEFANVVLPTGFLSNQEAISVYSYFCSDDATRRELKIKFNTTCRKVVTMGNVKKIVDFYLGEPPHYGWFPVFSEHCISFRADRKPVDGKVWADDLSRKAVITAIKIDLPLDNYPCQEDFFNINVFIREHAGHGNVGSVTTKFRHKLCAFVRNQMFEVSVLPPVELVSGRTYSIIAENHSTSDLNDNGCDLKAHRGLCFPKISREKEIYLGDVCMTFKEIDRKTNYYAHQLPEWSEQLALIKQIQIGLV